MDLNQYIKDATRTESIGDDVYVDPRLLGGACLLFVSAGNILDQIKKNVFYGKPYDIEQFKTSFKDAIESLDLFQEIGTDFGNEEAKVKLDVNQRLLHSIVGIATESTELVEALRLDGTEMDGVNLLEECADSFWYASIMVDELGGNWDDILTANINKLKLRYPEKFTSEQAINRNTDNERNALEQIKID